MPQFRVVAHLDPLAERIREQVKNLMVLHKITDQKALAKRAKLKYADVNKFIRGAMPFPKLTVLNTLLGVFSYTLAEALTEKTLPIKSTLLPLISRPIVIEIAGFLDDESRWSDAELGPVLDLARRRRPRRRA